MPTDEGMRPQITRRNWVSAWLLGSWWRGWHRWVAWILSIGCIGLLGAVRVTTDAEYAFASLAIFPVIYVAWFGGLSNGLAMAGIGALMWGYGNLSHPERFSAQWIPIINKIVNAVSAVLVPFAPVSVSAGLAWFEFAESPFPAMLRSADEAMYAAKGDKSSQLHVRRNLRGRAASQAAD